MPHGRVAGSKIGSLRRWASMQPTDWRRCIWSLIWALRDGGCVALERKCVCAGGGETAADDRCFPMGQVAHHLGGNGCFVEAKGKAYRSCTSVIVIETCLESSKRSNRKSMFL
ncbi:hypothetical protein BS47DRAFT_914739 [Hydnum rufescens UP504]|uniref:Uncharacterized protein n=1 Tax=Hydnum rufescens UP504 TaxID=1448309 RepID=A0A9P6B9I4_9AGAM|nr:hypothetical protein BS47DRAFT_914739 [Hydnum rufescens UP504]